MTLLQEVAQERFRAREIGRAASRETLVTAIREMLPPGVTVHLFGSITEAGRFTENSDIDLALDGDFSEADLTRVAVALEERLGRPVDLLVLDSSRLASKIRRTGEKWIV